MKMKDVGALTAVCHPTEKAGATPTVWHLIEDIGVVIIVHHPREDARVKVTTMHQLTGFGGVTHSVWYLGYLAP